MRHRLAFAALLAVACADPSDVLYTPPLVNAVEVEPGVFRVTDDTLPDYVRGFTPTGDTILFRGLRQTARGPVWEILGFPAAGGLGSIEHAGLYRLALTQPVATLLPLSQDRLLGWWQPGNDGNFFGPAGCPGFRLLFAWRFAILRLNATDGAALSSIPTWSVLTPTVTSRQSVPNGLPDTIIYRMRFTPGQAEAEGGPNPFGPAAGPAANKGFFSDGETLWRIDLADASAPPDSLGAGIFPAVSQDGALLAVAIPQGVDSTTRFVITPPALHRCAQTEVSYSVVTWTTAVIRLATGDTVAKLNGTEPAFDPTGTRIVVRRPTGLVWIDLASKAETAVPSTAGAFGAAVSPDGQYLAYSRSVANNVDVYFQRLK